MVVFMNLIGFLGLNLFHQTELPVLSIAKFSLSTGGSISLAHKTIIEKCSNPLTAVKLSDISQSVGYQLAAIGLVLMGLT